MNPLPFSVGLVFAAGSGVLLFRSLRALAAARASLSWPQVPARILKSEAVRFQSTSQHRSLFVEYEYAVDGRPYTGRRGAFYTLLGSEALALEAEHARSPEVRVYVNPRDPSESTLIAGPRTERPYSDLLLALAGLVIGLGVAAGGYLGVLG